MGAHQILKAFTILLVNVYFSFGEDENFGMCADPECSAPVALGKTIQMYAKNTEDGLSFIHGEEVLIFVRDYGPKKNLIGVTIKGEKGYVPKSMVTETKSLVKEYVPAAKKFIGVSPVSNENLPSSSSQEAAVTQSPAASDSLSFDIPGEMSKIVSPLEILESTGVSSLELHEPVTDFPVAETTSSTTSKLVMSSLAEHRSALLPDGLESDSSSSITLPWDSASEPSGAPKDSSTEEVHTSESVSTIHESTSSHHLHSSITSFDTESGSSPLSSSLSSTSEKSDSVRESFTPDSLIKSSTFTHVTTDHLPESFSSSESEDAVMGVYYKMTERNVHKAVEAITAHDIESTAADDDIENADMDDELKKTLSLLGKQGQNLTEILNDQILKTEESILQHSSTQEAGSNFETLHQNYDHTSSVYSNKPPMMPHSNNYHMHYPYHQKHLHGINSVDVKKDGGTVMEHSNMEAGDPVKYVDSGSNQVIQDSTANRENANNDEIAKISVHGSSDSYSNVAVGEAASSHEALPTTALFETDIVRHSETSMSANQFVHEAKSSDTSWKPEPSIHLSQDSFGNTDVPKNFHGSGSLSVSSDLKYSISASEVLHVAESLVPIIPTQEQSLSETPIRATEIKNAFGIQATESLETMANSASDHNTGTNIDSNPSAVQESANLESADLPDDQDDGDYEEEEEGAIGELDDPEDDDEYFPSEDDHVSPQRQILQDGSSSSSSTNEYADSETTKNPVNAFSEKTDVENSNPKTDDVVDSSSIFSVTFIYETFHNTVASLRIMLDYIILLVPQPVYSFIRSSGISIRAAVFTATIGFPCALLFFATVFIKERSKEQSLIEVLREKEHMLYLASSERDILRDEIRNMKAQLIEIDTYLIEEKKLSTELQTRLQEMEYVNKDVSSEQQASIDVIRDLHARIDDYMDEMKQMKYALDEAQKQSEEMAKQILEEQNTILEMSEEITRLKEELDELSGEKEGNDNYYAGREKQYNEKITQLQESCSQLLVEVGEWNTKVNELNDLVTVQTASKEDLEKLLEMKDSEIESLKTAFLNIEVFQNMKNEDCDKTMEEKMQAFMDISSVQNQLKKAEVTTKSLEEELKQEKNKALDTKVELLEAQSEAEKMKSYYAQAVKEKEETQQKLDFFTEYFKEKELQLQKELGLQEAVRQKKEQDATHAERHINLIQNENESYKYQVATLKKEIEETERNLKSQIAIQEKKAHENWLAARAAERKAEESKQETAQLRQRLTLLEREQENWVNSSQSDIVRPVAQRISDVHDMSGSHDGSLSGEFLARHLPQHGMHDDLPMRASSRPILPGGPPMPLMHPPPFMAPFDPMMPPPPRPPHPWRMIPDRHYDSDRRNTPSEFDNRRHHTPPTYYESDRRSLSPVEGNSRSRGSSPPEVLPDFHNVPPPLQRHPDFPPPPPPQMSRFLPPMHRPYKNMPPPRTGNRPVGNNGTRQVNDRDLRRQHPDADV